MAMVPGRRPVAFSPEEFGDSERLQLHAGSLLQQLWGAAVAGAGGDTLAADKDLGKWYRFATEIGEPIEGVESLHQASRHLPPLFFECAVLVTVRIQHGHLSADILDGLFSWGVDC